MLRREAGTEVQSKVAAACLALALAYTLRAEPPAAPTGVQAAIVSSTAVRLTWDAVAGADSYDVLRDSAPIGSSTSNSYNDEAVPAGAHLYRVRAVGPGGTSPWSASGLTTTFSDEPLIPRLTRPRAIHVLQLRDAINAMRSAATLPPTTFTDASLTGVRVKALHVNQLRSSLDGARDALGLSPLAYAHTITGGTTPIRSVDLTELRAGVTATTPDVLFWDNGASAAAAQPIACNSTYVFAGAPGIVRRSSDGGLTWSDSTGLPAGENVSALVNGGGGYVFAQMANTKLYRSTNHGATFSEMTTTPAAFTSLVGARNGVFAVGGGCASVWFSPDGIGWSSRNSGISGCVTSLARANRGRLYAGTVANGVFTSTNDGVSWGAVGAGIPSNSIRAIATDREQRVVVAPAGQGIYRSTNDGSAWSLVQSGDFASLIADSTGVLVAGTQSGARIHTSSDGGTTWLVASRGLPPAGTVAALCSTHRYRFAAAGGRLFRAPVELHLHGLNFSPFLDGQTDATIVDAPQILQRMQIVRPYAQWIRSFRVSNGQQYTARIARTLGLKTLIGARITSDQQQNQKELEALIQIGRSGDADILAVGNEVLLNGFLPVETLAGYVQQVKTAVPGVPVTYVDGFHICLNDANAALCNAVDIVSATIYPFWDPNGISVDDAIGYIDTNLQLLRAKLPGKPILISEAGWPTAGRADATSTNAAQHFREFETWARATGTDTFWFEAFDEDWKFAEEGGPGPHWGVWDENGAIKPELAPMIAGEWGGDEVLGGPGTAAIDFDLPNYVDDFTVRGTVQHVTPIDYRVAVFIRVGGVWWTKPYENARTTWIRGNGMWSALVKTHPNDALATEVAAYLIPAWYIPPFVAGSGAIPTEIVSNAVAFHSEIR
jgi:exo-beta-1,3-glucanase (GH17 family)